MGNSGLSRRTFLRGTAAAGVVTAAGVGVASLSPASADVPGFYNPFAAYPITGTWQDHLNEGSLGGIDFGMAVGTNAPACAAGVVTNNPNNGTGGYTVTIAHDNGYRSQYLHLSKFLLGNGTRVGQGAIVALSGGQPGAPGSGSATGPHLHWHMIDPSGVRINPLVFLGGSSGIPKTAAESTGVPGPIMWQRTQNWLRIEQGYAGPVNGVPGVNTYAALQRAMRAYGYTGPVNGVPGVNTWAAVQRLASHWGYTGPVNGVLGPNSWRGFSRFVNQDKYN